MPESTTATAGGLVSTAPAAPALGWQAAVAARWLPLLAGALAAAGVLICTLVVERTEQRRFYQERRQEVLYQVSAARAALERALHGRLYIAHSLAAHVIADPSIDTARFESFARRMLTLQPGVQGLALTRGTVVTEVYPRVGNEEMLGTDLAADPGQRDVVRQAIASGRFVLVGPTRTPQGDAGLAGRVPIFIPDGEHRAGSDRFWGLALVAVSLDPLLQEAGLGGNGRGLRWALRGRDGLGEQGEPFFGDDAVFDADPIALDVSLPSGTWRLAAIPADGWPTAAPAAVWIRSVGALLALLTAALTYMLARDPARLRAAVDEATAALSASERRFRALIDNSSDMTILLDGEGKVLFTSPAAERILGYHPGEHLGTSAFEIVHPDDRARSIALLRDLAERPGQTTSAQYRLRTAGGAWRWIEATVSNQLHDPAVGAIVVNCRDVTERVEAYAALEERVDERTRELTGLLDVSRVIASSLELDALIERMFDEMRRVLDYTGIRLWLIEGDEIALLAERGPQARDGAIGSREPLASRSLVQQAAHSGRPVVISDISADTEAARLLRAYLERIRDPSVRFISSFMVAPLVARERVVGVLTIGHAEAGRYTERDAELAMAFANQAAVAFENARLHEQAAQRMRDLQALAAADEQLHRSLRLEEVFTALADVAHELMRADKTCLLAWDADHVRLVPTAWCGWTSSLMEQVTFTPGQGNVGWVAQTGQPLVIEDLANDPNAFRPVVELEGVRSCMHVPIRLGGEVLGVFNVNYTTPRRFDEADRQLLLALAQRAALAIDNARLYEQTAQRTREVEALYRADALLLSSLRLSDVLRSFVDVAADLLRADKTSILVWDERGERLVIGAMHGFGPEMAQLSLAPGEGIAGSVAESRQPVLVEDATTDSRVVPYVVEREGVRSLMAIPIMVKDEVFGVFGVNYCQPHRFSNDELRLLLSLAQRTALAIENARLHEGAQERAAQEERQRLARDLHDAVTQTLFSASLIAEALPKIWQRSPELGAARTEELRELTRGALAEMRTLLVELRPSALADADLGQLLRQLGEAVAGRTRVPVHVAVEGRPELPGDVQVAVYRVAQEALNNAAKHAGATRVEMRLRAEEGRIELVVRDDGRGFDAGAVSGEHFGLGMMLERAAAIGGTIAVASAPGAGTTIRLAWASQARVEEG